MKISRNVAILSSVGVKVVKVIGHLLQTISKMRFSAAIADLPDLGWEQQARAWPLDTVTVVAKIYIQLQS